MKGAWFTFRKRVLLVCHEVCFPVSRLNEPAVDYEVVAVSRVRRGGAWLFKSLWRRNNRKASRAVLLGKGHKAPREDLFPEFVQS